VAENDYSQTLPDAGSRFANRRSVPRYPMTAAVEVYEPISNTRFSAHVSEISRKGCFVKAPNPLAANAIFQLRIVYGSETVETWGRAAYAKPGEGMGVAFLDTEQKDITVLESWIAKLVGNS
jgi:hypothetical protein